jgi:hypothetical protein
MVMVLIMIRDGMKGTLPNLPYNNVSELLGFLIHKCCEIYCNAPYCTCTFWLPCAILPALTMVYLVPQRKDFTHDMLEISMH